MLGGLLLEPYFSLVLCIWYYVFKNQVKTGYRDYQILCDTIADDLFLHLTTDLIVISQNRVLIHQRAIPHAVNEVEAKWKTVSKPDIGTTTPLRYSDTTICVVRISV